MTKYYLVVGNTITQTLDTTAGDVIALPLMEDAKAMSLINQAHVAAIMKATGATTSQIIARLGLTNAIAVT